MEKSSEDHLKNPVYRKAVSDFSNGSAFKIWEATNNAELKRDKLKNGKTAAGLYLPRYVSGPDKWPAMFTLSEKGMPKDWSDYDALIIECRKKTPFLISLGIFVQDAKGKKAFVKPVIDRDGWMKVQMKLLKEKLDLQNMKKISIYVTMPTFDILVQVKDIVLVSYLPERYCALEKEYRNINENKIADEICEALGKISKGKISLKNGRELADKLEKELRKKQLENLRKNSKRLYPESSLTAAFADSMQRILPTQGDVKASVKKDFSISLAGNEYEAFQIVVIPPKGKALKDVSVKVHSANGIKLEAAPIGFVKTKPPVYPVAYCGWHPDPILEFAKKVNIKEGTVQPFWVRVFAAPDARKGINSASIEVSAKGEKSLMIPVKINVYDFSLPKKGHLRTAISLYPSKLLPFGPEMQNAYDYVLDRYRLNPFSIYNDSAYGKPKLPELSAYKKRIPMGLNAIPVLYLKLPRQALFKTPKESRKKWNALSDEEKRKYPEKEKKKVMAILSKRIPELRKAGLNDMLYLYGFDEATPIEWPAIADLCKEIKSKYPDLKIYSTAYDASYGFKSVLGGAIDGWIPHFNKYDYSLAEKARKQGREVWWYSTRMFIDEKPLWTIRAEMGDASFKNKVDGFLYWTITRWNGINDQAIKNVPYTSWNPESFPGQNGGGSFLCMGPDKQLLPTIRLENIRDGLEDYEYLYLLKELLKKLPEGKEKKLRKEAEKILNSEKKEGVAELKAQREKTGELIEKLKGLEK
jgi:hypothetical protein